MLEIYLEAILAVATRFRGRCHCGERTVVEKLK